MKENYPLIFHPLKKPLIWDTLCIFGLTTDHANDRRSHLHFFNFYKYAAGGRTVLCHDSWLSHACASRLLYPLFMFK